MAQTFVAKRRGPAGFEQKVCLKRILPEYASDTALVEQFLDEARLLAHLRHANIVQVYDFGEADGSYFMALELIDGADLEAVQRYLTQKKLALPAAVALHIVAETLKALHYAHHAELDGEPLHLVHRDISPSNLLLSRAGEVKLADFGIAKSTHRRHKTRAGFTKGKVAYMSPEQVRGGELDGRSDLFAVGIVLHELLTGVHPFDADTDIVLLGNILSGTRPDLSKLTPPLRPELVRLIDALLAVDVAERPDTAADALSLVPSLEQQFRIERQIGEMVSSCVAAREVKQGAQPGYVSTPPSANSQAPANQSYDGPGPTTSLPTPPQTRPSSRPPLAHAPEGARRVGASAPPRKDAGSGGTTTEMPGLTELAGTDALMAARGSRTSSSAPSWLIALAVIALLGATFLGVRYASRPQVIAVQVPESPAPADDRVGSDGSAPGEPTQPAAAKPTDAPALREPHEQAESAQETSERAPVTLHEPGSEPGTDKGEPAPSRPSKTDAQRQHRAARRAASDEAPRAPRNSTRVEPSADQPVVAPVADKSEDKSTPKPAEPKKHRAGISISSDDF